MTDVAAVMADLGTRLRTITGLRGRVFDFPPRSATPPFAFVNLPETIAYDLTYGRGSDRFTIEVWVGVPDVVDRVSTAKVLAFAAGSGPASVKAAIEASTVFDYRVTQATFTAIGLAAGVYSGLVFTVDLGA